MSAGTQEIDIVGYIPLTKALMQEGPKGPERVVCGPVSSEVEDWDGEVMERSGVIKGLNKYMRLGGAVDYDHLYTQTHDPNTLIGRGEIFYVEGRPWLRTHLRDNELAKAVWDAVNDPNAPRMGYSVEGGGSRIGKRVVTTDIHMITISPLAKGFDQKVFPGAEPQLGLMPIAKALCTGGTLPAQVVVRKSVATNYGNPVATQKAFTTGAGVVGEGDTGGAALRVQYLEGAGKRKKRTALKNVGPDVPVGLQKALLAKGVSSPKAMKAVHDAFNKRL